MSCQAHALETTQEHHWSLGAGVGFYRIPDYSGAEHVNQVLSPIPYFQYRGPRLIIANGRLSSPLFDSERLIIDISADGTPPVKSNNNTARSGMPDLDPVVEVGPALEYHLWENKGNQLFLDIPLRYGLSTDLQRISGIGWISNPRLKYHLNHGLWRLRVGVGPIYANKMHNDYYYGVEKALSTSTRATFKGQEGYSGFLYSLGMQKRQVSIKYDAYFRLIDLQGSKRETSPLVDRKKSLLAGVAITWIFREK